MALSSTLLQAGGAATSAVGSYYAAKGQKTAANLDAVMSDLNAKAKNQSARDALEAGNQQQQQLGMAVGQEIATQRTNFAANGIDLNSQNVQSVTGSTALIGEIDKNTANANAVRTAWGYRTAAVNDTNAAIASRATAKAINPAQAAFTSLMGSAPAVASSWYSGTKSGAINTSSRRRTTGVTGETAWAG